MNTNDHGNDYLHATVAEFEKYRCDTQAQIADLKSQLSSMKTVLEKLYRADTMLRLRVCQRAPGVKLFSDWEKHTEAMTIAEQTLKP